MTQLIHQFSHFSNEDFKLWTNGLKPLLMDQHLEILEEMMDQSNSFKSSIRCRHCSAVLEWLPLEMIDLTNDDPIIMSSIIQCICTTCRNAKPIFQCVCEETTNMLVDLLDKDHPQILASAINLILIGGNMLNSLSPPHLPENPIEIVKSIYEQSPSILKFGGQKAVIIADIYEDSTDKEFPILYIADTVSIPTRYYMQPLKYLEHQVVTNKLDTNNNDWGESSTGTGTSGGGQSIDMEYLVNELIEIGNRVIQAGSFLVLGPRLQQIVSPDVYANREHNLSIIIPFDELKPLDGKSFIMDNFDEISKPAIDTCSLVYLLVCHAEKRKTKKTGNELYVDLQRHLSAAIWLKTFAGTPFESLLYHILDGGDADLSAANTK